MKRIFITVALAALALCSTLLAHGEVGIGL